MKTARVDAGAIVDGTPYPMALWSLDRRYCVFNSAAKELLGYCEDEICRHAKLYLERIHPEDRSSFLSAWKKLCDGETSVSCRYRFTPKDGTEARSLKEISLSLSLPGNDEPRALTLYAEERKHFKRMVEAQQLRSLLRGLTHEIGNNLQAISGEVELLRWSGALPAESATIVSSGLRQIFDLAYDIQEYFFTLAGEIRDQDLTCVVTEVLRKSEAELNAGGIRTEMVLEGALPKIPLDGQFAKALKAIVDFSRALLSAGGELRIEARAGPHGGDHIQLNVISVSCSDLQVEEDSVFRPFINLSGYRPGLSMAVAQQIVHRHSGKIVFRKERVNRGVFSVLMPVRDLPTRTDAIA